MWVNEPIKSVGDDVTMFSLETTSHLFHLNIIYNLCIEEIYKYTPVCFLPFYVGWSDHTFMHNHKYNSGSEEFTSVTRCNVNRVIWNWSKCHNVNVRQQLLVSYKTVSGWHPLVPSPLSHSPLIWLTNQSVSYVMWVNEPIKSIGDDVTTNLNTLMNSAIALYPLAKVKNTLLNSWTKCRFSYCGVFHCLKRTRKAISVATPAGTIFHGKWIGWCLKDFI